MRNQFTATALLVVLMAMLQSGCRQSAVLPKEGTPEHAISLLEKHLREGDADGYFRLMPKDLRDLVERMEKENGEYTQASVVFNDAVEARFGEDARLPGFPEIDFRSIPPDRAMKIVVLARSEKPDGTVDFRVNYTRQYLSNDTRTTEETITAKKEDGNWKVSLGSELADLARIEKTLEMTKRQTIAFRKIAEEVKAGKYADGKEARRAWRLAQEAKPMEPTK